MTSPGSSPDSRQEEAGPVRRAGLGFASPASARDRSVVLFGILLALFLAALDQTIVATALPHIAQDLHAVSRYTWVVTAYLLSSTVLVPVYGKLADTYSRRLIEVGAVVIFLAGSALCGLAGLFGPLPLLGDGMTQLVLFRGLQGVGGAGLMSMALIVIADFYPPAERGRYQGLVSAVWAVASVAGPLLGGLLTDHAGGLVPGMAGWRWVFWVNLPLGAVALWVLLRRMPALEPLGDRAPPDRLSVVLLLTGLIPLVLALQLDHTAYPWWPDGSTSGWAAWATPGLLGVAAVLLWTFAVRSLRVPSPILDFTLFESRVFRTANVAALFFGAVFLSVIVFLPLFLIDVLGMSATAAGITLIPYSLGVVVGSTVAGQLVARYEHLRDLILVGGFILLAAVLFLARMTTHVELWRVTLYMVMAGFGSGPSFPLLPLAVQNAVDVRRVGQATSATQFSRQIGGTLGTAVMGSLLAGALAAGYALVDLPPSLVGPGRDAPAAVAELASGGGEALPRAIRRAHETLAEEVDGAVRSGDADRIGAVTRAPDLARHTAIELEELVETGAYQAAPDAVAETAGRLAGEVRADGESAANAAGDTVRGAFREGIHDVFALALVLTILALFFSFRIPEMPLRRTHDRSVAEG